LYLGTPQNEQSIYPLLGRRGYKTRIWPARYPSPAVSAAYGDQFAPRLGGRLERDPSLAGKPTDPKRFGEFDLLEREASYGRSGFALQFMLDTTLSDADRYPLKLSDFSVLDLDLNLAPSKIVWGSSKDLSWTDLPNLGMEGDRFYRPMATPGELVGYQGSVLAIDPSGRGKDETAYSVVKHINGHLFLAENRGFLGGYLPSTLEAIALDAKKHAVKRILVESNFGDGMFSALLQPVLAKIYPCTIEEIRHSSQKEKRIIDTLEPILNQHRLTVDRAIVDRDFYDEHKDVPAEHRYSYKLFHQLTRITKERGALLHDDRLESLAMAVSYWTESVKLDVDKRVEAQRKAEHAKRLREFVKHAIGYTQDPPKLFHSANRGIR
jgi:hypothetical protein